MDNVLPIIKKNNVKIILITSKCSLPQLFKSDKTDVCINDKNILLWISTNPIYSNNKKYMAIPSGFWPGYDRLNYYIYFVKYIQDIFLYKDISFQVPLFF
jgi:hypothetical protein